MTEENTKPSIPLAIPVHLAIIIAPLLLNLPFLAFVLAIIARLKGSAYIQRQTSSFLYD